MEKQQNKPTKKRIEYNFNCSAFKPTGELDLSKNNLGFYDLETAPKDAQEWGDQFLDIRTIGIVSFCVAIPKQWFTKSFKDFVRSTALTYTQREIENKKYIFIMRYDEDRSRCFEELCNVFSYCMPKRNKQKRFIAGFNNNSFDDLIFHNMIFPNYAGNGLEFVERKNDDILKDKKLSSLNLVDLKHWSKSFGLHSLKMLGKYLDFKKYDHPFNSSIQSYLEYNMRDVEILIHFVNHLNSLGCYKIRPSMHSRSIFSGEFANNIKGLTNISCNGLIDKFTLFGGRTEPYFTDVKEAYYLDVNSLYPSVMSMFKYPSIYVSERQKEEYEYKKLENMNSKKKISLFGNINPVEVKNSLFYIEIINRNINKIRRELKQKFDNKQTITPQFMINLYEKYFKILALLKVNIKSIHKDFEKYEDAIKFYFPFPFKKDGQTIFAMPEPDEPLEIQFYEVALLALFDYEIISTDSLIYRNIDDYPAKEKIQELYAKRKQLKAEKNPQEKEVKIVLNSGYGILATKNREWETVTNKQLYDFLQQNYEKYDKPKRFLIQITKKDKMYQYFYSTNEIDETIKDEKEDIYKLIEVKRLGENFRIKKDATNTQKYRKNTIPVYALATTSNARYFMYSLFLNSIMFVPMNCNKIADLNKDMFCKLPLIYYTDTDSIFTNKAYYEELKNVGFVGNDLGQIKLEYDNKITNLNTFAPKSYYFTKPDGDIKMTFKGTGKILKRKIISQSIIQKFQVFTRTAIQPEQKQKRKLQNSIFLPTPKPEPGTQELIDKCSTLFSNSPS
jgi:hypothetical protein